MTSHGGYTFLLYSLATSQSLSWTLKGFLVLTQRPSSALDSPRALLSEIQRYKDMVRCGTLDAGGPKTPWRRTEANLLTIKSLSCLLKRTCFRSSNNWRDWVPLGPPKWHPASTPECCCYMVLLVAVSKLVGVLFVRVAGRWLGPGERCI